MPVNIIPLVVFDFGASRISITFVLDLTKGYVVSDKLCYMGKMHHGIITICPHISQHLTEIFWI